MVNLEDIKKSHKVVTNIKIRYADLDTLGHVNNASYFSFLEESRIEYFEEIFSFDKNSLEFGVVVARVEIDYLKPVLLGDKLQVYTRCVKMGIKSLVISSVLVVNGHQVVTNSNVVIVAVDKRGKSVEIKDDWRRKIEEFEKK